MPLNEGYSCSNEMALREMRNQARLLFNRCVFSMLNYWTNTRSLTTEVTDKIRETLKKGMKRITSNNIKEKEIGNYPSYEKSRRIARYYK